MAEGESRTVPINEEVLDEYHNLIDQCHASCIATSETFELLGQICCFATTIDDFELPRGIYKFAHSSWFVACLLQVVNEGCAAHYFELQEISEIVEEYLSVVRNSVQLALDCFTRYFFHNGTRYTRRAEPSEMHTQLVQGVTECQTTIKSNVEQFDAVMQLISEIIGSCSSGQAAITVDTLVMCMQAMKNSKQQWQIILELLDRLFKLLSFESIDREKTACIAVAIYFLLKFNLDNNEEHMDIRLAVLDMVSTNATVQVQKEKVAELKDKCEKFKQAVKARTKECKENARDNFKHLLTIAPW